MGRPMGKFTCLIAALLFGVMGCGGNSSLQQKANNFWFSFFGNTLGSNVREFALRELHLNVDSFLGKSIIVSGKLVEFGDHRTYAVIADSSSKLLVSLVKIGSGGEDVADLKMESGKEIRVLGTLEVGKRGLPIVVASAVFSRSDTGDF